MPQQPRVPANAHLFENQASELDGEQAIVRDLLQVVAEAGVRADPRTVAGFYVTLKSQSSVILVGPRNSGKTELVRVLAELLAENPALQFHEMVGHARWASNSSNTSFFVELQEQFNTNKLLVMIEEAARPQNTDRLFIACLKRISPAELVRYFSLPGFQFWPLYVLPQDGRRIVDPIPFPPNFRLIGTMDSASFQWWDSSLLSHAAVMPWSGKLTGSISDVKGPRSGTGREEVFLRGCIRQERSAYAKLKEILRPVSQPFLPLMQLRQLLRDYELEMPTVITRRVVIYLANAWSIDGRELLDTSKRDNLMAAMDLALAQYVLPLIKISSRGSQSLRHDLDRLLRPDFVRALAALDAWM